MNAINLTRTARALMARGLPLHRREAPDEIQALVRAANALQANVEQRLGKSDDLLNNLRGEFNARLTEVEQRMASERGGGFGGRQFRTLGAQFVESQAYRDFRAAGFKGMHRMETRMLTGDGSGADSFVRPGFDPQIAALPWRRMTIRDLLDAGRTTSNAMEYIRQTGFDNQARSVTEGAEKPQSGIEYELLSTPVRTIAHWIPVSRQLADDAPALMAEIDSTLRYGLQYVEELQILKGDGTGVNLEGIIPQATAFAPSISAASPTRVDEIRIAILQAELAEYPVTGVILNPTDWAGIQLIKDSIGLYVCSAPTPIWGAGLTFEQLYAPMLWGRPVVVTNAIDPGEFLVGAFGLGAKIYDRQDPEVMISDQDRDNFIKNMLTVRAEERVALAVKRPESIIYGEFQYTT